jgi:hypothetical protein
VVKPWSNRGQTRLQVPCRHELVQPPRLRRAESQIHHHVAAPRVRIEPRWIRGHNAHPENERCDRLAVAAIERMRAPRR